MVFRVCIHETADVEAAQRFWLAVTGADPSQFRSPTLKRHVTKTVRMNVGDTYFGCLRVEVRQSGTLYRKIEAWASAASLRPDSTRSDTSNPPLLPGKDSNPR